MKICVFTSFFPPYKGGFSRYVYEIVKNWINLGVDVEIISTIIPKDRNNYYDEPIRSNIRFIKGEKGTGYFNRMLVFIKFVRFYFSIKPDFIFFPVWYPYSIFWMALRRTRIVKTPYIIGCHGTDILGLNKNSSMTVHPIIKFIGRVTIRHADALFTISNFTSNELLKLGASSNKIHIFPNGVDNSLFIPKAVDKESVLQPYNIPNPNFPSLLTVAQLNRRKGVDTVIKIVYELAQEGYFVNYFVIGFGFGEDENRLQKMILDYGLTDQVFLLRAVSDETLIDFYNLCDIFVLLSRHDNDINVEGFGIVFLEANACKKPVVAGNSGGIPDAVENNKTGFLVDPEDGYSAKCKIQFLLDNPEFARQMGEYGRKQIEEKYDWSKITARMLDVIKFKQEKVL